MHESKSVLIVGGGVIGLSIAWELACRGQSVVVLEKNCLGKKASWAGAGILAPANAETASHPIDKLMGFGNDLHRNWAERLRAETGIDNGYRNCGGIYIARTPGEKAALVGQKLYWREYDIEFEEVSIGTVYSDFAELNLDPTALAIRVPGESQIKNPDHLAALVNACELAGVRLIENCGNISIDRVHNKIRCVSTFDETLVFDEVCFCAGAWTSDIVSVLGAGLPMIPVRGQMLLYKLESQQFTSIINEGSRYIVPRSDGHVLVGSTIEEAGFDESTTPEKITELSQFASGLVPALDSSNLKRHWAGLRPASNDGFPFMGRLAGLENAFVATGHFKIGLQVSPAVAVIMSDLMEGIETITDIKPFDPCRLDLSDEFRVPNSSTLEV